MSAAGADIIGQDALEAHSLSTAHTAGQADRVDRCTGESATYRKAYTALHAGCIDSSGV